MAFSGDDVIVYRAASNQLCRRPNTTQDSICRACEFRQRQTQKYSRAGW